jgi:hypothetical protein
VPDLDQLRDLDRLRELGRDERRQLIRALVALEVWDPVAARTGQRRRLIALSVIIVCCLVLAAWIGVLAVTLPRYYRSGGWRGAWVGFDVVLLVAFAITGWAAWRRRQVLIICLIVLATLLCCDAWFDVLLDAHTKGFELSVLSAVCVELPLAALAILGARRLLRMNFAIIRRNAGELGPAPGLRRGHLVSGTTGSRLSDLFADCDEVASSPELSAGSSALTDGAEFESEPGPDIGTTIEPSAGRDGRSASLDGRPPSP